MREKCMAGATPTILALFASLVFPTAQAQEERPLRNTLDLQVPMAPAILRVDGQARLIHELHLTNFAAGDVELSRIEVLDDAGTVIGDLRSSDLTSALGRPGGLPEGADPRRLAPGSRAVAYIWLALADDRPAPRRIRHRLEFDLMRSGRQEQVVVESLTALVRQEVPIILGPPLRGGPWAAVYDPSKERGHRRVFYAIGGRARLPARFAIDWVKVDESGKSFDGDEAKLTDWYGYGEEVLAVADAVVAAVRDGIAESTLLPDGSRPRNPLEKASGNFIALDIGQGQFAFYEHLKPGSITVKVGDGVRRGQPIAAVGSTGDSMGAHLHFHVSDANATLAAEGLPYVFARFDVLGAYDNIEAFVERAQWKNLPQAAAGSRAAELPGANSVVMFSKMR